MGSTYTRQSTFTDGDTITADLFNTEFDQLVAAFAATSGHSHDGTAGEGGPIGGLITPGIILGNNTIDVTLTFDGGSNDGVLKWMEDEDYFEFSDDILIASTEKLQFRDTAIYINSSADGQLDIVADTEVQIAATTIDINGAVDISGNLAVGGNLVVTGTTTFNGGTLTLGDSAADNVVFGADVNSSIIPNTDDTYDLGSASQQWRNLFIDGTAEVDVLSIAGTAVTSTAAELNLLDGVSGLVQADLTKLAAVDSTAAELNIVDGGTSATSTTVADADRVVMNDNGTMVQVAVTDLAAYFDDEITAMPNLVSTGALNTGSITSGFGTIDTGSSTITTTGLISGGSLDIDNVLINGTTIGHTDDTDLITLADGVVTVAGEVSMTTLDIGGTNVTSTAAELNILDGKAFLDEDNFASNSATGIASQQSIKAYVDGVTTTSITSTGALNSGSITSGFGNIDTGSSTITTTGLISGGSLDIDNVLINGTTIGHTDDTDLITLADGVVTVAGEVSMTTLDIGGTNVTSTAAELNALDGITAVVGELNALDLGSTAVGTAIASKAVVLDSNKDYTGIRNFTITGNLSVGGTTTVVDTVTMNAQNAVLFEGATADAHETTLTIVDPTADRTINLPNQSGTVPVLAAASNTAVTSTPEELNILDGVTSTAAELNILDVSNTTIGDLTEISTAANDDVFIAVDTSGGGLKKITRSAIIAGTGSSGDLSNVAEDTSPQLGGNLDLNGNDIVTTSNATLDLAPNGTGTVVVRGNTNSGAIVFNCESNSHGQKVIAQPHSASVTNTMLLPAGANSTLVSLVSTDTLTNKTLTSPKINEDVAVTSTATEINLLDGVTSTTAELNALDGITAVVGELNALDLGSTAVGTAIASKAMVLDSNKDYTGVRNFTLSGELDAGSLDISGNADIDGTLETDALSINGTAVTSTAAEINALDGITAVVGELNSLDLGSTAVGTAIASKAMILDSNKDYTGVRNFTLSGELDAGSLDVSGNVDVDGTLETDALSIAGTAVTSTAAELNLLDGSSANSVVNSKAVIYGSSGELAGALSTAAQTNVTSLGTLTALAVDDVAINGKAMTMTGSSSDTAVFTVGTNGTLSIVTTDDAAAAANIQITADGTAELAGTTVTLDSGGDIDLAATNDVNLPANVGLTFGNDAEKIEGDGTDLTIAGNNIKLTAVADVIIPANVGVTFGSGEKIEGDNTDLTITSGAKINLSATSDVVVPANVGITFGSGEKIEGDNTDLTVTSGAKITLAATSDVHIPNDVGIVFGGASEKIEGDGTDLTISGAKINLNATTDVHLANNIGIVFGDAAEKIEGDGTDLTITGNNINLTAAADVVIPANIGLLFGSGEKIEGDSTDLTITSGAKITLAATSDIHVPNDVGIVFGGASEKIEGDGTDLTISGAKINLAAVSDVHLANNIGIVFGDAGEKIEGDGTNLAINSSGDLNVTATTIDINGNVEISGTAVTTGVHTFTAVPVFPNNTVESADIQADAITGAKIADDAINSEHYTDGSIDTAHIADNQITLAKMAGIARGKFIVGDSGGNPAVIGPGNNGQVLTSDGTDIAFADAAGGPAYTRAASAPGSPSAGDWWFNTGYNVLYLYDGTDGWITNSDRGFGKGLFIAPSTFSLLAMNDGRVFTQRFETEAQITADRNSNIATHSYQPVDADGTSAISSNTSGMQAVSNTTRGVLNNSKATNNGYVYFTLATHGAAAAFGDAVLALGPGSACDHATRGVFAKGAYNNNSMEYITIASTGNAADFGNLTQAREQFGGQAVANTTRGVFHNGISTSGGNASNVMDYITIASVGNATDFGNLTAGSYDNASACSIVRGLIFSGTGRAQAIDYITIASVGNATDFGDHLSGNNPGYSYAIHNKIYAYYGRVTGANYQEKHTIATAANATAFTWTQLGTLGTAQQHCVMKGWIAASG